MSIGSEEAVLAIHRAVFGNAPDQAGLRAMIDEVADAPTALMMLADRMRGFADGLRASERASYPDHSQNGEFRILLRRLVNAGRRHGIIVDVGVLGREGSNSYDLITSFGWKGLLIEANPALLPAIRREFGAGDVTLIGCAVGVEAGRSRFHIGADDGLSSLDHDHAAAWGPLRGEIEVDVRRLPDLLAEAAVPPDFDILDLDIEGLDVAVLNDLIATSAYRPGHILIEASYFFKTQALADVGLSEAVAAEYEIVDKTVANLVLARRGA